MELIEFDGRETPAAYLGDSVYVICADYGHLLRLGDHRNEEGQIYLEPAVMNNLNNFILQCNQLREKTEDEREES